MKEQIKLKSCPNFRDLGGYEKAGGSLTAYNKIFRSDCLSKLSQEDIAWMEKNNIRCVIDLRYINEIEERPNPLSMRQGFYYYNVSLKDGLYSSDFDSYMTENMGNMYISLIDEASREITEVFRIISNHTDCGVVFHCTAGKDRTGVIAAILLLLAGVSKEDIVSDYAMSYGLLKELLEIDIVRLRAQGLNIAEHVFLSEPKDMRRLLEHIEESYASAENYLLSKGLSPEELKRVKSIL